MRLKPSLPFLALALCCFSCGDSAEPESPAGIEAIKHSAVWSGSFVSPVLPHPVVEMDQKYFRPSSDDDAEWIAIVPAPLAHRARLDVPVRIRGRLEDVELGGPAGTKASYRGKKLLVTEILDGDASVAPSRAPGSGASEFTEACLSSSNLERPVCECCGQKAESRMSPLAFEFLTATLQEDKAKVEELRPKLSMQEAMQAGMFMVGAPGECAAELQGQ